MPLIVSVETLLDIDGVTPIGCRITPSGGQAALTINSLSVSPATLALGSGAVETAVQTSVAAQLPTSQVLCHCFTTSPFDVTFWFGDLDLTPPSGSWWLMS